MGAAYFYHLTRRPLADTLRTLLEKARSAGWRIAVRGTTADGLSALDTALWQGPADGFLPHGVAGGPQDADQPILLTLGPEVENNATCVFCVHGSDVTAKEVEALDRVCILFDGDDEAALAHARGQWKALKAAGASAQYWSEESGRWEKKAET